MTDQPTITDQTIQAATRAIHDMDCDSDVCTGETPTLTTEGRYGRWARAAVEAAAPHIAAAERERIARYIDRAVAGKRRTAALGLTADTIVADAWAEAAGWLREPSIWADSEDDSRLGSVPTTRTTDDGDELPGLARLLVDATDRLIHDTEASPDRRRELRVQAEQAAWNVREHLDANRQPCTNCRGTGMDTTDHGFEGQPAEVHPCGYCGGRG